MVRFYIAFKISGIDFSFCRSCIKCKYIPINGSRVWFTSNSNNLHQILHYCANLNGLKLVVTPTSNEIQSFYLYVLIQMLQELKTANASWWFERSKLAFYFLKSNITRARYNVKMIIYMYLKKLFFYTFSKNLLQ